jgi:phenylacetate-CoA ligase
MGINAETLFVEILDEKALFFPMGKGHCNHFLFKAHPFIRYDIGDIGILDEKALYKDPFAAINRTNK